MGENADPCPTPTLTSKSGDCKLYFLSTNVLYNI